MVTNMPDSFDGFRSLFQERSRVGRLRDMHPPTAIFKNIFDV